MNRIPQTLSGFGKLKQCQSESTPAIDIENDTKIDPQYGRRSRDQTEIYRYTGTSIPQGSGPTSSVNQTPDDSLDSLEKSQRDSKHETGNLSPRFSNASPAVGRESQQALGSKASSIVKNTKKRVKIVNKHIKSNNQKGSLKQVSSKSLKSSIASSIINGIKKKRKRCKCKTKCRKL